MKTTVRLASLATSFALGLAGCGPELPETVSVTGKVVSKGQPIANAQIGFIPQSEGGETRPALGTTAEDGTFTLRTYVAPGAEADGAMVGDYTVTVQKTDVPIDPVKLQEMFRKRPQYVPPALLPARYGSPNTTPLKATVIADGPNEFTLEIEGEVKQPTS